MVDVLPFNGLRFDLHLAGDLSKIIAPPYDIISPQQKQNLKSKSRYNVVNLTLPDDSGDTTRYENAKATFRDFIKNGILKVDPDKCFYIIEESFTDEDGNPRSFTGLIGLLKIEDYGVGKVLRHEKTLSKPKEDRLKLLNACRANFEFIYTIYNDADTIVSDILENEKKKQPLLSSGADYDPLLKFKLWKISDKNILSEIIRAMKSKTLLIADGHHRYETSRLYSESVPVKARPYTGKTADQEDIRPEDCILSLFVSANQKDISIHPTHRLIKFERKISPEEMTEKISKYFAVEEIPAAIPDISEKMSSCLDAGKKCICIVFENQKCLFAVLKTSLVSAYNDLGISPESGLFDEEFENLDVNILHKLILSALLKDHEIADTKFIHTVSEIIESLATGTSSTDFDAGFILNAPSIETVENLSDKGLIMPQKSTYFYPKPCSGLVIYEFGS